MKGFAVGPGNSNSRQPLGRKRDRLKQIQRKPALPTGKVVRFSAAQIEAEPPRKRDWSEELLERYAQHLILSGVNVASVLTRK